MSSISSDGDSKTSEAAIFSRVWTSAPLPLQALLDQCYRNGGYDDLDYRAEPDPPLAHPEGGWANELLKERGLRPAN